MAIARTQMRSQLRGDRVPAKSKKQVKKPSVLSQKRKRANAKRKNT